jgi:GT2 family glycosyltransferase
MNEPAGPSPWTIDTILCTFNNAGRLRDTLEAFTDVEVPSGWKWTLVVVDNNSSDCTAEVVASFADLLPLEYVFEKRQGLARARNAGLAASKGSLVTFTDDDVYPTAGWLRAYCEAFLNHGDDYYFGGPIRSVFEGKRPHPDVFQISPISIAGFDGGPQERPHSGMFAGANWGCSRASINGAGGFSEAFGLNSGVAGTGEESELQSRLRSLGVTGLYLPPASLDHRVPKDKASWCHVAKRLGAISFTRAYQVACHSEPPADRYQSVLSRVKRLVLRPRHWRRNLLDLYTGIEGLRGYQHGARARQSLSEAPMTDRFE